MRLSKNVTAPLPGSGLTVAAKVTCWPSTEGFVEDEEADGGWRSVHRNRETPAGRVAVVVEDLTDDEVWGGREDGPRCWCAGARRRPWQRRRSGPGDHSTVLVGGAYRLVSGNQKCALKPTARHALEPPGAVPQAPKVVLVKLAPVRVASAREADGQICQPAGWNTAQKTRSAPVRLAEVRLTLDRFVPSRAAEDRFAFDKSSPLRLVSLTSAFLARVGVRNRAVDERRAG